MDYEKLYSGLPDFIKYNNFLLNFFLSLSKKLNKINNKSKIIKSQNQLLELILLHSNFEITGTLRNVQLVHVELLKFIDNVCNKYEINYWLNGGTLLGAVRHEGFIPWDDDIDINMMREDYEKLIKVFPDELNKYDYFKKNCGLSLLRNNHENYFKDFNSVYEFEGDNGLLGSEKFMFLQFAWLKPYSKIDIFPRDYINPEKLNIFNKKYLSTKYKFNQEVKYGKKDFNEEFTIKNSEIGFTRKVTNYMNDGLDSLQLYPICIHETDKVFPLTTINFEGYNFKCPNNVDYYLKKLIGSNYMHLPNVIENHDFVKFIESQFFSKNEMDDKFKKDIKYLRMINENFE